MVRIGAVRATAPHHASRIQRADAHTRQREASKDASVQVAGCRRFEVQGIGGTRERGRTGRARCDDMARVRPALATVTVTRTRRWPGGAGTTRLGEQASTTMQQDHVSSGCKRCPTLRAAVPDIPSTAITPLERGCDSLPLPSPPWVRPPRELLAAVDPAAEPREPQT